MVPLHINIHDRLKKGSCIMSKTITGIVTWLRNWFYTKDEKYDTGWQQFPYRRMIGDMKILINGTIQTVTYEDDAGPYMEDYPDQPVRIRRVGKVVHIDGAMRNIFKTVNGSTTTFPLQELAAGEHNVTTYNGDCFFTVGTLDPEFRPSKSPVRRVQQGSGINRYLLIINTDGTVKIGRYGISSYVNPQDGCWLNMNMTYLVG